MPFNIQGPELILILIIALIVIGPGKLPDVGAALGKSIREFRKASTDVKDATRLDAAPATASPASAVIPAATTSVPTAGSSQPAPATPVPATPAPDAAPTPTATPASADTTSDQPA